MASAQPKSATSWRRNVCCSESRNPCALSSTGAVPAGVTAKDMALAFIAQVGADGGQGFAVEFAGPAVEALSMEGRMTLCNMSIEAGARFGIVAPDEKTFAWLDGRDRAPAGEDWTAACEQWRALPTEDGAAFDVEVTVDATTLAPMITYGVSPDAAAPVDAVSPPPMDGEARRGGYYMQFEENRPFTENKVNRVFIGSCTNSRLTDLRLAATVMRGRKVRAGVTTLVVPGSEAIRRAAEEEGLDKVFLDAGAEWREPGCSMCIAMNGDAGAPGDLVVSNIEPQFHRPPGQRRQDCPGESVDSGGKRYRGPYRRPASISGGSRWRLNPSAH